MLGITSWTQAADQLNATLVEIDATLIAFSAQVSAAEGTVSNYEQQAQDILEWASSAKDFWQNNTVFTGFTMQ